MPDTSPAIVALDRDGLPLDCAAKICSGTGLSTLQRWLGDVIQVQELNVDAADSTLTVDLKYVVLDSGQQQSATFVRSI